MTLFTPELFCVITDNQRHGHRPLMFGNARIITLDPLIGDFDRADLLLAGSVICGVGPGLLTAVNDDNAIVIDCDGYVIVPAIVDTTSVTGVRVTRSNASGALAPGNPATFAVVEADPEEAKDSILRRLFSSADPARVVVVDGTVRQWDGQPVVSGAETPTQASVGDPSTSPHLGSWIDESGFLHQHLTADGRYDETRGGRAHAYQGSFRIEGDRIDYFDNLGFWAYGEFVDGHLQHAGYTMHRH